MVAQEQVKGVRIHAPEELRCHQASILQRPREPEEPKKGAPGEAYQLHGRVFFLQIRFLRVAYDQGTVKVVAQEEVKGVRILAPEEVRWH